MLNTYSKSNLEEAQNFRSASTIEPIKDKIFTSTYYQRRTNQSQFLVSHFKKRKSSGAQSEQLDPKAQAMMEVITSMFPLKATKQKPQSRLIPRKVKPV